MQVNRRIKQKAGMTPEQAIDMILDYTKTREAVATGVKGFMLRNIQPDYNKRHVLAYMGIALRHLVALGFVRCNDEHTITYHFMPGAEAELRRKRDALISARREMEAPMRRGEDVGIKGVIEK